MKNYIILAVIACVVVWIVTTVFKKDNTKKTSCPSCGKPYGGSPRKCPHCGGTLRWKNQ